MANLSPQFFIGTVFVFIGFLLEIKAEDKTTAAEGEEEVEPLEGRLVTPASEERAERAALRSGLEQSADA